MRFFPVWGVVRRTLAVAVLAAAGALAVAASAAAQIRDNIFSVSALSAAHAWVVGAFGTVYRTDDGGVSWKAQASGVDEHLFGVAFADGRVGWAVGRTGVILHTDDGGETWTRQHSPHEDRHLFHVAAIDAETAVAIGDWGTVVVTNDRGRTWEDRSLTRDVILNSQYWLDAARGWLVGEGGAIVATADGGRTWQEKESGVFKTLFGITFANADDGWAAGNDGLIVRTTDGGESWSVVRGAAGMEVFDEVEFDDAFANPTLFDIAVRGRFGVAVGDLGAIFASADGGVTWTRQTLDGAASLRWIRAVWLDDAGSGFAVGARGLTLTAVGGSLQAH